MKTRFWLVSAVLTAGLAQAQSGITRDGKHWVQTATGTVEADGRFKVLSRGAVRLQGENRGDIEYTLRKRARALSEGAARATLSKIVVKSYRSKGWTVVNVVFPPYVDETAELHVRVPKKLKETALETQIGAIEAYDLDGSLYAQTGGGPVQVDRIGSWVKAGTGGGFIRIGKVEGLVKAWSAGGSITADWVGGDAYLNTAGGEIVVREARGRVEASAGAGGNIRIERAEGGAALSTGGGIIEAYKVGGAVRANTGTGAIKVRSARSVELVSGSGQIQLHAIQHILQASTAFGSIIAELMPGQLLEDSVLMTQSGDITVYIPSNVAVTVEAMNASPGGHRIVSEFKEVRPRLAHGNLRTEARGAINGGGATLRLTAQGGTIYLRRRD